MGWLGIEKGLVIQSAKGDLKAEQILIGEPFFIDDKRVF